MTAVPITLVILGPTAGGKTAFAIALARNLARGGECLCADSMQIYRGMDIGTAKPTPVERDQAVHHLLDLVDPDDESFSVDRWLALANQIETTVKSRGKHPIVVGGTNLYIRAFLEGLFDGPPPNPALRNELESDDLPALRLELERVDPEAANRIHPNDRKRTIRAIEVFRATGQPISELQREWDTGRMRPGTLLVGLDYPPDAINRRINERVRLMVERGLVEEARNLWETRALGRLASEALGYRQLCQHFEGLLTLDEAVEQIKIQTRRYAKQQRTWLKRFRRYPNAMWFDADGMQIEEMVRQVACRIEH